MSLFTIERYDEEKANVDGNTECTERSLMNKLLRKSEKRKRKREELKHLKKFPSAKKPLADIPKSEPKETTENHVVLAPTLATTNSNVPTEKPEKFQFQILGEDLHKKNKEVERVLPRWLSHPHIVHGDLQSLRSEIDSLPMVDEHCQNVLRMNNITHYFPIQTAVIPYIIKENQKPTPFWRKDICISATTGSGKTLAYVVPIITVLRKDICYGIEAVIIAPVQELASQIYNQVIKFTTGIPIKVTLLSGFIPLEVEQQNLIEKNGEKLICKSNIIVTTPGRLVEHLHSTPGFSLHNLKFLVLDEADRMMDREKHFWIYHLHMHSEMKNIVLRPKRINLRNLEKYPNLPQKILASATMTTDPEKLARVGLLKPILFTAEKKYIIPKGLVNEYCICNIYEKTILVYHLITNRKFNRVLCFVLTKIEAQRLALVLGQMAQKEFTVGSLSSMDKRNRLATLKRFENGEINVLISTDALARGIDIPNIDCVLSFNPAKYLETYVHRVGRTSRAGQTGTAITFLLSKQERNFKKMLSKTVTLNQIMLDTEQIKSDLDEKFMKALELSKKIIQTENNLKKKKQNKIKYKYKTIESNVSQ